MRAEARAVLAALEPGSVVCCAVSGGADSVALLHLLWGLCPPLGLTLRAAHFNHCLRGAESDGDAAFVQDLCRRWGIPLTLGRGDAAARAEATGESIEEAARALRRAFLLAQPGYIATAHNADDQVETILINLLRGTGLKGLGGMAPAAGRIVRPLLSATRADILTYLTARGLSWREDSTNALDDALRNRLRHHVLPLLRAENPSLSETVGRSAAILREEEALLAAQTAALLERAKRGGGWDCATLAAAPAALRTRALRQLLGGAKPAAAHVAAVEKLLQGRCGSAGVDLPGGRRALREYGLLRIARSGPETFDPVALCPGRTVRLGGWTASLRGPVSAAVSGPYVMYLRPERLSQPPKLLLRPRQSGDRLRLSGGEKTVKALMIDAKIPAARRGLLPVAEDGGVAAVCGLGPAWDRMARPGETAWMLEFYEEGRERHD